MRSDANSGAMQTIECEMNCNAGLIRLLSLLVLTIAFCLAGHSASAQGLTRGAPGGLTKPSGGLTKPSGGGLTRPPQAGPVASVAAKGRLRKIGVFERFLVRVRLLQAQLHRRLGRAVRRVKTDNLLAAIFGLCLLSFGYGVVHAVGPGHGKAVISSYVLANERTLRRGVAIAFLAGGFQALSAILLVGIAAIALNTAGTKVRLAAGTLESISYALVALVGAWLLYAQLKKYFAWRRSARAHASGAGAPPRDKSHDHGPAHVHDHSRDHGHSHDHDGCCGHAHMPEPTQLDQNWSWRRALTMALAVGIRPCTGAVIVLIFALAQGLFWAGVGATFAMSLGTSITVSVLAVLAVGARQATIGLVGGRSGVASAIYAVAGIGGSALILAFGVTFFIASIGPGRAL